jgi:hypothetical protein
VGAYRHGLHTAKAVARDDVAEAIPDTIPQTSRDSVACSAPRCNGNL